MNFQNRINLVNFLKHKKCVLLTIPQHLLIIFGENFHFRIVFHGDFTKSKIMCICGCTFVCVYVCLCPSFTQTISTFYLHLYTKRTAGWKLFHVTLSLFFLLSLLSCFSSLSLDEDWIKNKEFFMYCRMLPHSFTLNFRLIPMLSWMNLF